MACGSAKGPEAGGSGRHRRGCREGEEVLRREARSCSRPAPPPTRAQPRPPPREPWVPVSSDAPRTPSGRRLPRPAHRLARTRRREGGGLAASRPRSEGEGPRVSRPGAALLPRHDAPGPPAVPLPAPPSEAPYEPTPTALLSRLNADPVGIKTGCMDPPPPPPPPRTGEPWTKKKVKRKRDSTCRNLPVETQGLKLLVLKHMRKESL